MTTAVSTFMEQALGHHRAGNLEKAEKLCRQILRVDPKHSDAFHLLGVVEHQQQRHVAAVDYIGQAIDLQSGAAPYWNSLGAVYLALGQSENALAAFQRAIQIEPRFPAAFVNLGLVLRDCGEAKGALACFRQALVLDSECADAWLQLGAMQQGSGDAEAAARCLTTAVRLAPGHAPRCCTLADEMARRGQIAPAMTVYWEVAQVQPELPAALFGMGQALLSQGELEEARAWFEQGLAVNAGHASGWANLGCIESAMGNALRAETCFRRAVEADASFTAAHFNLGNSLAQQKRPDEAAECYRRALELDPRHSGALKNLGNLLMDQERFAEAEACYRRAAECAPGDAGAHLNLGQVLKQQRKFDEAAASYRGVLEIQPENAAVHYVLGRSLELSGRHAEAVESYRRAAALNPVDAQVPFHLGNTLKALGRINEAIDAYRRAKELDPANVSAEYQLGNAYRIQKRFDEARDCYEEVLRNRPDDLETRISLGNVLKAQDDLAGATAQYRAVLDRIPDQPLWRLWIATLCPIVFHGSVGIDDYRARLHGELKRLERRRLRIAPQDITQCGCPPPYVLQFHGRDDRPLKEAYARVFEQGIEVPPLEPRTGKPHVGFVVTDGHEGVFLRYLRGVIERLNRELFDVSIVCSAGGKARIAPELSPEAARLLVAPTRFDQMLEAIRQARFDLLYHWEVGSDVTNYFLPMFKLAPVQCTGAGVPVTSGLRQIDYFLSDGLCEPDNAEGHYTETLVRARSLMTFEQRLTLPELPKLRMEFGFAPHQHLYVCPHKIEKFHPDFDTLLRDILRRDPDGVVVIPKDREGYVARKLRGRFALTAADVAERIVFLPYQTLNGYLSLLAAADVLLDPLHYGGGLTSFDGFSLNQPIVTLPGEFLRGRFTSGFYRRMEIDDCVAESHEDYVDIAVKVATDADFREAIRDRIRERSPVLFEDASSVPEYEELFTRWITASRQNQSR